MTKQIEMVIESPLSCIYRKSNLCKATRELKFCDSSFLFPNWCPLDDVRTCHGCKHLDMVGSGTYVCPIILMGELVVVWPNRKACGMWGARE